MDKITSLQELRQAIAELEVKQRNEEEVLRACMHGAVDAVKPANIIKSTVRELTSAPKLKEQFITAIVSLGAGWLAKKLIQHESDNSTFGKILGLLAQYGISAAIASNPEMVKVVSDKVYEALTDLEELLARTRNTEHSTEPPSDLVGES